MFKFVNKIPLDNNKITLLDIMKKQQALTKTASVVEPEVAEVVEETTPEVKEAEVEVTLEKEAGKLPKGLQDYLDKKNGKGDKKDDKKDKKDDKKDKKEDKDDKKSCCAETETAEVKVAETEKVETKVASSPKWVKVAKLTAEQKTKLRDVWGKVYPKDYLDAWLAD